MKKILSKILIVIAVMLTNASHSQELPWWQDKKIIDVPDNQSRYALPEKYRILAVDLNALRLQLNKAPMEFSSDSKSGIGTIIHLPMPDGSVSRFKVVESPMMENGLAQQYPDFKTYGGQGIDDVHAIIKISVTRFGLHTMILSPSGSYFIDPFDVNNTVDYVCYDKKDFSSRQFICEVQDDLKKVKEERNATIPGLQKSHGTQLRNYRLAVAATGEYTSFHGGTVTSAMAAIVASVNRVNGVYENEVAVRLTLVANNSSVVYTNSSTDPYTNGSGTAMLGENTTTLNNVIGTANYDIGHVFSTGGGGVANLNGPCGSNKARGVTGSSSPVGDAFDIDYVAHEMGHQYGANHTFNAITGSCSGGNRSASSAYEPGSGITIMAYAGICTSTNNLAPNSIAYFHTRSFDEITTFITNVTSGGSCPVTTSTGNNPPVGNPGSDYTIPISTPFTLTGSATDANGDPLVYSWEQYDLGSAGDWNAAQSSANDAPLFRPFPPVTSPSRTFPKISDIVNNTTTIGEVLPTVARTLDFRLTVRDNRSGGGGVMHNDITQKVTTVSSAGPFLVTYPNTAITWATGSSQTVTWNVASTDLIPINCSLVNILLSTDGGYTFPVLVTGATPNDGSQVITVPNNVTSQARIKIEAAGNIFFDMSNTNFTIVPGSPVLTAITTNPIGASNICAGSNLSVSYTVDGPANAGNVFTAQLSNSSGSFLSPVNIGTLNSTTSGTISSTIPGGTATGTGYRIRVISSNPIVFGSDNGSNLSIFQQPANAGVIAGSTSVCQGQNGVVYTVPAIANATGYSWTLPSGATIASGSNTNSINVNYNTSATSGLVSVAGNNAGCGNGNSSSLSVTVNALPATPGSISGPSTVCQGVGGYIYTVPAVAGATGYIWTLPAGGSITSGNNTNSITASFSAVASSGNITVAATNSCGNGNNSSPFSVVMSTTPTAAVISAGGSTTVCSPGNVSLSFTPQPGHHYQWRKNGVNLNADDTLSTYQAASTGVYDVVSTLTPGTTQTFTSPGSVTILDNSCSTPSSNIDVTGYSTTLPSSQIKINLNISHTWVGDLVMLLESPNGQRLGLANRLNNGSNSGDNFVNTVFTDAAAGVLPPTGAPYTGSYQPLSTTFTVCTSVTTNISSFAGFNGGSINPNGQWRLRVYDQASADGGTISNWSITFPAYTSGCNSVSNSIPVTINPLPSVAGFTPSSGSDGSNVTINGTGFSGTTAVQFNGMNAAFVINSDTVITATVPAGASSGPISITNSCGTDNSPGSFAVINNATLNLNLFIEGLYTAGGTMQNAITGNGDTIRVNLISTADLNVVAYTATTVLSTTGSAAILFPSAVIGNNYYIAIKHRNSIETWSKNPVLFNSVTNMNLKN